MPNVKIIMKRTRKINNALKLLSKKTRKNNSAKSKYMDYFGWKRLWSFFIFKKFLSLFLILGLLGPLAVFFLERVSPASADVEVITPSLQDTWIDQKSTDKNHGEDSELKVKSKNGSDNRRTLVSFALPLLPEEAVIESATLSLYMKNAPSESRTYEIYRVLESWIEGDGGDDDDPEGEIVWGNKPDIADEASSAVSTGTTNGATLSWNVTDDIIGFYDGDYENFGWTIRDESESNVSTIEAKFRSREHTEENEWPTLEINYSIPEPESEPEPEGFLSGYKFNDLNGNGVKDDNEPGLANWTIWLDDGSSVTTDENGYYEFSDLDSNDYYVCEEIDGDWTQTYPNSETGNSPDYEIYEDCNADDDEFAKYGYFVEIDEDEVNNLDFGNIQYGSIMVTKEINPGESNQQFGFTLNDGNQQNLFGWQSYTYENLISGAYNLQEILPEGWILSSAVCSDESDPNAIDLEAGENVECTFFNTKLGSITVTKIADPAEGSYEFSLQGPTPTDPPQSITVEAGGSSIFENLGPGEYQLSESVPDGWTSEGSCDTESGEPSDIELPAGGSVSCVFNNTKYGSISGRKFEDLNANGADDEDPGLEGWIINIEQLTGDDEDGEEGWFNETETSEDGYYVFTNLLPGTYRVCESMEDDDWYQSLPTEGTECSGGYGYEIILGVGEDVMNKDFGNYKKPTITVYKYNDTDGNGQLDEDEPGLENWEIILSRIIRIKGEPETIETEMIAMSLTGVDGSASFLVDNSGEYRITENSQSGWQKTHPADSFFDVFVELNGQEIDKDKNENPLKFLNHQLAVISNQAVDNPTENSVVINWTTDKPSTSRVIYDTVSHPELGDAPNYGYAFSTTEQNIDPKVLEHSVAVTGLTAGTTYYYRTVSAASPESVSSEGSTSTSSSQSNSGSGGGGGGAPGGIILNGPTPTPTPISSPAGEPTPTPGQVSASNNQSNVSGGNVAGASSSSTSDMSRVMAGEDIQSSVSPEVSPETTKEEAGREKTEEQESENNLFASIGGLLNSVSLWWLLVLLIVIVIGIYANKKKRTE